MSHGRENEILISTNVYFSKKVKGNYENLKFPLCSDRKKLQKKITNFFLNFPYNFG